MISQRYNSKRQKDNFTVKDQIVSEYFHPEENYKISSYINQKLDSEYKAQEFVNTSRHYFTPTYIGWLLVNGYRFTKIRQHMPTYIKPLYFSYISMAPICLYVTLVRLELGEIQQPFMKLASSLPENDKELARKFDNLWSIQGDARLLALEKNVLFNVEEFHKSPEYQHKIKTLKRFEKYNEHDEVPIRQIVQKIYQQMELLKQNQQQQHQQNYDDQLEYDENAYGQNESPYAQGEPAYGQEPDQTLTTGEAVQKPQEEEDPYVKMMKESAERTNRRGKKWD